MIKRISKTLFLFLLLTLFCNSAYSADFYTSRYNLCVPEQASRDWISKVSNDIISIDNVLFMLSQDSGLVDKTNYYSSRSGKALSADVYRMPTQTASPDTVTSLGAFLCVSKDTTGVIRLNFYNGTTWQRVTLE